MHGVGKNNGVGRATAVVMGAALLFGSAACGGSGETDENGTDQKAKAAASGATPRATGDTRPAAGAATATAASGTPSPAGTSGPEAERLGRLVLASGEKVGPYESGPALLDEPFDEIYDAAPAVCQPLTGLGRAGHTAQAYAPVSVPDEVFGVDTDVLLRSYKDAGAAGSVMKSLAVAGKRCAAGYTEERTLVDAKVLRVEPVPAPKLGDEALAYRIVVQDVKDKGASLYTYLTLVRSDAVTLSFRSDMLGVDDFGGVPGEIVTAQWEKFSRGAATR
ncbi:hypothetical protein OS965_32195 [Streptomyces sp. H27-G5]|uniref:hypothetical protein n=1 Tax=Streptomyces sp. H27-G5 TaxID=2996698 RepID=UPI00226F01FB|nr:hypothetical protein [Streptomyces sp. H27-G5]MCY0922752.1 hypothetical protein [Streptomyces sp. H27-G5]